MLTTPSANMQPLIDAPTSPGIACLRSSWNAARSTKCCSGQNHHRWPHGDRRSSPQTNHLAASGRRRKNWLTLMVKHSIKWSLDLRSDTRKVRHPPVKISANTKKGGAFSCWSNWWWSHFIGPWFLIDRWEPTRFTRKKNNITFDSIGVEYQD